MNPINIWAIITATIVAFIIGAIWYSPLLFSKQWAQLIGMTDADMASARSKGMIGMWKLYVSQLVVTFITFIVVAFFVSNSVGAHGALDGMTIAFLGWLGYSLPVGISGILWKKHSCKLLAIEGAGMLLNLLVGGAIIGGWAK